MEPLSKRLVQLQRVSFTQSAVLAIVHPSVRPSVSPSVYLSITRCYCVKTPQYRITWSYIIVMKLTKAATWLCEVTMFICFSTADPGSS